MLNQQLTEDQIIVLNNTSTRSMVQVVYYDTIYRMGGTAATSLITEECWRRIEPLNDHLKSPLYSKNQIAGGRTNLSYEQDFVHSIDRGVTAFVDLNRDNLRIIEYIESRSGFGADCIEDMMAILDAITEPLPCKITKAIEIAAQASKADNEPVTIDATNYNIVVNGEPTAPVVEEDQQQEGPPLPPDDLLLRAIRKVDNWINKAAAFLTGL